MNSAAIEKTKYFRSCIFSCMSQKAELPSLTGHRTKTRKRDEKKVEENFEKVLNENYLLDCRFTIHQASATLSLRVLNSQRTRRT